MGGSTAGDVDNARPKIVRAEAAARLDQEKEAKVSGMLRTGTTEALLLKISSGKRNAAGSGRAAEPE